MNEDPRLYAIAKRVTLEAGFDYTDPRTLETTRAQKQRKKRPQKKLKKRLACK